MRAGEWGKSFLPAASERIPLPRQSCWSIRRRWRRLATPSIVIASVLKDFSSRWVSREMPRKFMRNLDG